jgi:peptidyl-prolyl cis-trans isomerase D
MLSTLRRYINTWVVRGLFLILVASFGLWGIADVVRNLGISTAVATVDGHRIELPALQDAYQRQLAQVGQMFGANFSPTPAMRRSVADQALDRLITQAVIDTQANRMGLVVTDEALRQATFAIPAFRGSNGQFDRSTFLSVLQRSGLDENRFLALMREDLSERQLLETLRAGTVTPAQLTENLFAYQQEKRTMDAVEFSTAAAPAPSAPTEAQLQRFWDNNPENFSTPELRHIKAIVLSVQTIARDIDVSDQDVQAAYDQRRSTYEVPEKRSAQVLLAPTQQQADDLAQLWRSGAPWPQMQDAANHDGGSAVELDDATAAEFPDPALASAVFAAPLDSVPAPVQTALGWHVLRVIKTTPGVSTSFEQARESLRTEIAEQRASDQIYDYANKVQDAMAGGAKLDELPQGLGLAAATGTLDAQGNTPQGQPAPIPGSPELRSALIAAAFAAKLDEPPHLTEVPGTAPAGQPAAPVAYYAVTVDSITPPAVKPFDSVRDQVRQDWMRDAQRHEQEMAAARLYSALQSGQPIADAALVAGVQVRHLPPTGRQNPPEGVPPQLLQPLFGMKKGEATMIETAEGFLVGVLTDIQTPDATSDPIGYGRMRDSLARAIGDDIETTYITALRTAAKPQINSQMLDSVVQP